MSLNFRYGPRRRSRRNYWLSLIGVLILAGLVAWQQGWRAEHVLARLGPELAIPYFPDVSISVSQFIPIPKSDTVVMVGSNVFEHPQSKAYTAELYASTGKDVIPWPNAAGRTKIQFYTAQYGDTLWSVAAQYELDLDTLRWSNPELERNPDVLAEGTELRILPVQGLYHAIEPGDTIEAIAARYGVAPQDITNYPPNGLFPPYHLADIEGLIIPYGRKDINIPRPSLSLDFPLAWPVVGAITGGFEADHQALDIGAPYGSTVYAADDGTIVYADWALEGYGYTVVIDHGNGRQSWYNHLKGALLPAGNVVSRGTPIGEVGSTGHSTGPHLHFEVRVNGEQVNPLDYLPGIPQ
jgi:murein DD-endopeptidase MepM/ murein hydrolase activator NlpD